jgi:rhodanese-related sulfurtransferase
MKPANFLRILGVALLLAGHSAWVLTSRSTVPTIAEPASEIQVPAGIRLLRVAEAESRWHDPGTLFLDVRSATDYEFGHIAGAISFPEVEFAQRFPPLQDRLRQARAIVVYCKSTDCGLSLWAAIRLHNEGLKQTMIFPGGWNEWFNRGLPSSRLRS